jgi:hypothetical protein
MEGNVEIRVVAEKAEAKPQVAACEIIGCIREDGVGDRQQRQEQQPLSGSGAP